MREIILTGVFLIQLIVIDFCSTAQSIKYVAFTQASQTANIQKASTQSLTEYISTSDNVPATITLKAVNDSGRVPSWLFVNGNNLNGISYTGNSEIIFVFDANYLQVGTYFAKVTAASPGYDTAFLDVYLTVTAKPPGPLTTIKVNFQDASTLPPAGWLKDFGEGFGLGNGAFQGSGNRYGWVNIFDHTPLDLTKNGRKRAMPSNNLLQATLIHMQAGDAPSPTLTSANGAWEVEVENGNYNVTVSAGDGENFNSKHSLNIEGVNAISNFTPSASNLFQVVTLVVSVTDGFLTIDPAGGVNTKINYVSIAADNSKRPSVVNVNPPNSSVNVNNNSSISTSILLLPNGGIDNTTITSVNVYLQEEASGVTVPSSVNGTGGGDGITLVPNKPLKLNTTYRFTITPGVKDLADSSFIPYSSIFTTGFSTNNDTINAKFKKVELSNTIGQHSSLAFGPDGKLYALTINGIIERYTLKSNGTLGTPEKIYTLQDAYGSRADQLAIGFAFDPASTKENPIVWITHSTFVFLDGPDWDGKLSKLSGPNLENFQDVIINLPRSTKDHLTNSIAFGPDGALYFNQGCNTAMGRGDKTWNYRNEHLLSASCLRLDVSKINTMPLDAKTAEGGGTYNPYAANAPLTLYATGIRNAYDLIWHSNGELYLPTNGSAAGGNTPASVPGTKRPDGSVYNGPAVPALGNVQQTQNDYLFRIVKGGYYGHPNPLRGQYVLNGGNPTSSIDPAEVIAYPIGTLPDTNYRGYSFNFQADKSPDGVIEYKSEAFGGALKGKILVVRYSQNNDIVVLTPGGADNDIISAIEGSAIEGFSGFSDPLDLAEDVNTGNIYVSEYGDGGRITLLKAAQPANVSAPAKPSIYPNPVQNILHIKFPETTPGGNYQIQLIDALGRIRHVESILVQPGKSVVDQDMSKLLLTPGMYFLRIGPEKMKADVLKLIFQN
ncbi:MAG: Ig-like domain-containing protein [Ginsengibacter sp.]